MLQSHWCGMHESDFGIPDKQRSAGAASVINWDEWHLSAESESSDGISAMDLQRPTVLLGKQFYQVQNRGTNPAGVRASLWPHVDAGIIALELAYAYEPGASL